MSLFSFKTLHLPTSSGTRRLAHHKERQIDDIVLQSNSAVAKSPPLGANGTKVFELALEKAGQAKFLLRLYVTGMTPNSRRAIENVTRICQEHLENRCDLEIVDIYQQPVFARQAQILAAPTLVKEFPLPLRRFIGDMSNTDRLLAGLGLRPLSAAPGPV